MRESIGTAWIMIIVMTFIALFSGYLAFSINYSKSFRVKDGIIERIHKHNGINSDAAMEIDKYLNQINYNAKGNCKMYYDEYKDISSSVDAAGFNGTKYTIIDSNSKKETYNYCIFKIKNSLKGEKTKTADASSAYYKVVVFFSLQIGNLSFFSNFKTTGETGTIYYPKDIFNTNKNNA
ncbi:MAG: hypothetical protein IKP76_01060 [Bacilli bacterium]|nr:hypothetical protein [Bacilli bacterium]